MPDKPDGLALVKKFSESTHRVLFDARQETFAESAAADVYDDIINFFPFAGDVVGNAPRIVDAVAKEDGLAVAVHSADFAIAFVPAIGFVLDWAFPANSLIKGIDYAECVNAGSKDIDCAVPKGTFEREIMEMMH